MPELLRHESQSSPAGRSIRRFLLILLVPLSLWILASWLIADRYFESRTTHLVALESVKTEQQADDVVRDIRIGFSRMRGIPSLVADEETIRQALSEMNRTRSQEAAAMRKSELESDPEMIGIGRHLKLVADNLGVDQLWLLNSSGDCIAASNSGQPDSFVGTNYAEREYFQQSQQGFLGSEFAVGKVTHVPGLYFASPVRRAGRFMGVVAAKMNLPNLAYWVEQSDAFVADSSGVIILARDRRLQMRALQGASVYKIPLAKRFARYRRADFQPLAIGSWGDSRHPNLLRFDDELTPRMLASRKIPDEGLEVFVTRAIPNLVDYDEQRSGFFWLLALAGCMAILAGAGLIQYQRTRREARIRLLLNQQRLDEAQRIAQVGSWELDLVTNRLFWSDEIYRIFEIDPAKFSPSYDAFLELVPEEERETVDRAYTESVRLRTPYEIVHRLVFPDGRVKHVHERCETLYDAQQRALRSIGTVQDVTERVRVETALKEARSLFLSAFEYAAIGMALVDPGGRLLQVNRALCQMLGYGEQQLLLKSLQDVTHPEDFAVDQQYSLKLISGERDSYQIEQRYLHSDGRVIWGRLAASAVRDAQGKALYFVVQFEDVTDRRRSQEEIRQLAYFDTLTNLPNRRLLLDRLKQGLAQAKRHHRSMAIIFLDLDRFKLINDTLGHDVGDKLLKAVAQRLTGCIRVGDTVSRQGGDEFVILLQEVSHPEDAARVAEKVIQSLVEPVMVDGHSLTITVSLGIAVYPIDGTDDSLELMKKADIAMYRAKEAGRNGYRFY